MITRTTAPREAAAGRAAPWQRRLGEAVASLGELLELLELPPDQLDADLRAHHDFPLRVPRGFVRRMRPGDPHDPLLLQVLPRAAELLSVPGFVSDPLAEAPFSPVPGLLHKYRGRVLLVVTGACAVHCRYCFRRHFPYAEHQERGAPWRAALDYVASEPSIEEVILSGGDPLSLSDERLRELARALARIPHLRRLRLHSRLPIVLPERVDEALLAWLAETPLEKVMVVHANHPREIDAEVIAALRRLGQAGVTLLNQAVLLRGVNDEISALAELSATLFAAGVLPYYLHLLDKVAGAAHFEVGEDEARSLLAALMARLPGYLVPRLVREVPGATAKIPIAVNPENLAFGLVAKG